ncbi:MAG: hypothetical protein RL701_3471 [Pseudomonadota bacterium]|jgi:MYXO-CTERM domain-containing protein
MTRYCAYLLVALIALETQLAAAQGTGGSTGTGGTGATTSTGTPSTGSNGTIAIQVVEAGGRDYTDRTLNMPITPIGKIACDEDSITVALSHLPTSEAYPYLEAWYASGQGACNQATRNTRTTESQNCTKLEIGEDAGQIRGRTFYSVKVPLGPVCDSDGAKSIFFLGLRGQDSAEEAQFYGVLTFTLDTEPPSTAYNLYGGTGETQIPVKWSLPATSLYSWILIDTEAQFAETSGTEDNASDAGTASAECTSAALRAGAPFDPTAPDAESTLPPGVLLRDLKGRATEVTLNGENWPNKVAAVTVIAADRARNVTAMSEVACLKVVKTSGFWDKYRANGGTAEPGLGCSVSGVSGSRASAFAGTALPLLGLVGLALIRRRIRRRAR